MNVLAVILARAHSVGLPRKHLLPLGGRAVIEHTFDHAAAAKRVHRTVLSSDCPHIRALASNATITSIDRPEQLASADASVQDALLHALDVVESRSDFRAAAIVTLYGNVPVRPGCLIDRAIDLLERSGCDSVRSFCPVGKWHPQWMTTLQGDRVMQHPAGTHRRQDLAPMYLHEGGVVACTRAALERGRANRSDAHAFFGIDRRAVLTEPGEVIEIDTMRDLMLARAIVEQRLTQEAA
jgi:N-acylneuraminate cytidylyltransferase